AGVAGDIVTDGCTQYIDYTFNITDDCENAADAVVIRVSRHYDETKPIIADRDDVVLEGCNAEWPAGLNADWTDNCGINEQTSGEVAGVAGDIVTDGCTQYIDYTFNITDDCENAADAVVIRVSRHYDETKPTFECPSNIEVLECEGLPIIVLPEVFDNCDEDIEIVAVRSDGLALNDPYPVGELITIKLNASDFCNNAANECEFTVLVNSCDAPHCTYTQGFYGNYGGLGCTPNYGTVNSHVMMINALTQVGGSYNFGSLNTGNYFLLKLSDVTGANIPVKNNIFTMLPGGGTPRALVGFATYDIFATWSDNDPLYNKGTNIGRINNNLLSQTMTLFFNLQMDGSLSSVVLEPQFATAKAVSCGSDTPDMNTVQIFKIPSNVIYYLNNNGGATVSSLFALANRALGGENIGGLSASNVNSAVDAINRGYDQCRIKVVIPEKEDSGSSLLSANFTVYPVPFNGDFTIRYEFDYQSPADIQVFDAKGSLLMNEHDENAYFNKEVNFKVPFNHVKGELYYVKVITRKGVTVKKIISTNR
uniref:T9SS type A sorting domain-containing protein n=1 Tax=Flavobacterium sp. TaxID=239 RepID=UPI002A7FB5DA